MRYLATIGLAIILAAPIEARAQEGDPGENVVGYKYPLPGTETPVTYGKEFEGLAPGRGREETYYAFAPCRKLAWIKEQNKTLDEWKVEVPKMATECKIGTLVNSELEIIAGYLADYYGKR